ncbi:proline-rich protein prcc [Holotrichia oblita]|uniref:Proline-rich protein prcc n=1 Tax=Holotrichia oblita TaxID=644536 RepID=A0ACB9THH0_HOLOL|nr:proline-rich protein prcc [Holotrichia oblita]
MMSLVAYTNSDSDNNFSEDEDENKTGNKNNGEVKLPIESNQENELPSNIFKSLPQPQLNTGESLIEEDDEYLKKKEVPTEKTKKQPIKISVPSLADFDSDDEETPVKKAKIVSKSSGLFALLPPPKGTSVTTKHFVPNSVKKTQNKKIQPLKKAVPSAVKTKDIIESVDSEDDDDGIKDLPDTFDDDMWQKVCGRKEKRVPRPIIEETIKTDVVQSDPEVTKPYDGLDNQAFKELVGGNSKRKGEAIDIVEITEDEILCDKKIWMTKSLTDPEMAPKFVVKDPVNDTCKRKHHITYLAQQAKANEQELQNQWAQSRFTRQKTQAKYGF